MVKLSHSMTRGSKQKSRWSSGVWRVPQGEQALEAVDRLALGVGAVELDVAEGLLGLLPPRLERRRSTRPAGPGGGAGRARPRPARGCAGPAAAGPGPGRARGTTTSAPRWAGPWRRRAGARGTSRSPGRRGAGSAAGSASRRRPGRPPTSGSGPLAATAMMAADTRSTGMTSTMPSGTPGNSLSSPRAKLMITGSAMRKPRIQPGRGLGEGGLDDRGPHDADAGGRPASRRGPARRGPWCRRRRRASRARRLGPGRRATMRSATQRLRSCSVLLGEQRGAGRAELAAGLRRGARPASRGCGSRPRRPGGPAGRPRPRRASRRRRRRGSRRRSCSGAEPRRLPAT